MRSSEDYWQSVTISVARLWRTGYLRANDVEALISLDVASHMDLIKLLLRGCERQYYKLCWLEGWLDGRAFKN